MLLGLDVIGQGAMQLIRCTAKLRKEMGIQESALYEGNNPESELGPWHANLVYIDGRKCALFVNDKTLINFIAPDVSRTQIRELSQLFLIGLNSLLDAEEFSEGEKEKILSEYSEVQYAKSNSKSVLGSMSDLSFHYKYQILAAGGIFGQEIQSIIGQLNRIPMAALEYAYPVEEIRRIL
jgi:hypothetical protein